MPPETFNASWSLVAITLGFYGLLIIAMLGMISALWLRMGYVMREFGGLQSGVILQGQAIETSIGQLRTDMERNDDQLRQDMERKNDQIRQEVAQLRQDMKRNDDQLRTDMERKNDQIRQEVAQLRQDIKRDNDQLRQDMDRNHGQLMRAILAHSHRPDGSLTFDLPPEFNPTPADD